MSQQGPMMQPQQKSGVPGWLMGCGIGCGILAIVGIAVVVLIGGFGYFTAKRVMEEAKPEAIAELNKQYDAYVEKGFIPDEHRALYDELREMGSDEQASFPVIIMCFAAIEDSLQDGEVSEKELQLATEVRDFVKENPQAGWMAMFTFIGEHPEFQEAFDEAQQEFGVPSEPGAMDDEGMEEPPAPEVTPEEVPTEPAGAEQ